MDHALSAAGIFAGDVVIPVRLLHELPICWVMGVSDEVARRLPSLRVPCRIAPWRALESPFTCYEIEVERIAD